MIDLRKAYAWEDGNEFFLSRLPKRDKAQPKNTYSSKDELMIEARKRGVSVVWDHNTAAD